MSFQTYQELEESNHPNQSERVSDEGHGGTKLEKHEESDSQRVGGPDDLSNRGHHIAGWLISFNDLTNMQAIVKIAAMTTGQAISEKKTALQVARGTSSVNFLDGCPSRSFLYPRSSFLTNTTGKASTDGEFFWTVGIRAPKSANTTGTGNDPIATEILD